MAVCLAGRARTIRVLQAGETGVGREGGENWAG